MDVSAFKAVMLCLQHHSITLSDFLLELLVSKTYQNHPIVVNLIAWSTDLFIALINHPLEDGKLDKCARRLVTHAYLSEVKIISAQDANWHFRVHCSTLKQFEEFNLEDMGKALEETAPKLWSLLGDLLAGEFVTTSNSGWQQADKDSDAIMIDSDQTYWDAVDDVDLEGFINGLATNGASLQSASDKRKMRRAAILLIRRIILFSIIMNSTNQKANALPSILGFFFQSMHVPQKVIETLARIGISISNESIAAATHSLSVESSKQLRSLGQSLLASYAYDNFDVDLKSQVSVVKKSNISLKHLTSGLLFPLVHGITTDDLRCSMELWKMSMNNPDLNKNDLPPKRSWKDLLKLHPEQLSVSSNPFLSRRDRFNSWKFMSDLCSYGPIYFRQFNSLLCDPEVIEQIPLVKTELAPARAMDINNSTVSGNIQAIIELLTQAGVYDPIDLPSFEDSGSPDLTDYVILVHGDLGTGECLQAAQIQRSLEETPWDRFQHVVFIPGLFHLKMACADAIWRCFIHPLAAREDETSLMQDITQLRPRETGIYISKPGFHRMHQLIGHAGVVRRLDCWRTQVLMQNSQWTSLEAFAASQPSFEDIQTLANELVLEYIAADQLYDMRQLPASTRDMQFKNAIVLNKHFLLYEELTYAMNLGDIGRLETCITTWIPVLKAVGKHKYATHMTNFLLNVHFMYPAGLKRAVRYHMLVNPTGANNKWRGVDWCVELNNLFTKVKNGGKGSNRTVERIILESPLVQAYRNTQAMIQMNFLHTHLSTKHGDPDMTKTFTSLANLLAKHSPHKPKQGRKARHEIPDLVDKGRTMMEKAGEGQEAMNSEGTEDEMDSNRTEMSDILTKLLN